MFECERGFIREREETENMTDNGECESRKDEGNENCKKRRKKKSNGSKATVC